MVQKINKFLQAGNTCRLYLTYYLVFTFEETRHATAATGEIESSSFDEEEVLLTQHTASY